METGKEGDAGGSSKKVFPWNGQTARPGITKRELFMESHARSRCGFASLQAGKGGLELVRPGAPHAPGRPL